MFTKTGRIVLFSAAIISGMVMGFAAHPIFFLTVVSSIPALLKQF